MLNQRHIIPCFPALKVCRHMGTALSLWAVRRRSPSCHSCYRSVFRPAFTDGSHPAWHVRQRISKLKTPTPIREPSLIRPADSAAPVSWAAYCRSFFNSSGATTECLRFSGFSALAFIRQALQAALLYPADGKRPESPTWDTSWRGVPGSPSPMRAGLRPWQGRPFRERMPALETGVLP